MASRRRDWLLCGVGAAVTALVTAWLLNFLAFANFAVVEPGRLYRSGQMEADDLEGVIAKLHIASVVNLRGANPQKQWYRDEVRASEAAHVVHYDLAMGARDLPSPELLSRLLEIYATGPYPMLIHCNRGADRTGLAAAVWLLDVRHASPGAAAGQLSLIRGHVPVRGYETMDRFVRLYADAGGLPFGEWVKDRYPALLSAPRPVSPLGKDD